MSNLLVSPHFPIQFIHQIQQNVWPEGFLDTRDTCSVREDKTCFCTGTVTWRHSHTSSTRCYLFLYKTTSPSPQKPKHAKQENPFPNIAV